MSDLYFNEKSDHFEENKAIMKTSTQLFLNNLSLSLNRKKRVIMRDMRKKLQKQSFEDILQNKCSLQA